MDATQILMMVVTFGIPVVIAITFHEAAHGFVAYSCGDSTAKDQGRMTLNPLKHIDPIGTVVLPGILIAVGAPFLFGYAKPVPVNFRNLRRPRTDMVLVAAAGPGTNFLLAFVSALLMHTLPYVSGEVAPILAQILRTSIMINVVLGVFNMLPLPPLDGGRVAVGLLPPVLGRPLARLEPYGFFILIGAIIVLPMIMRQMGSDFSLFSLLLGPPIKYIMTLITGLAGLT